MLCVKHAIVSAAGLFGGVFGYVSVDAAATWHWLAAFVGMFAFAWTADVLTHSLEEDEDEQP